EKSARERTRTIPDGVYEAESFMDDDGVEIGKPVPIKVRIVKKADEMTIDLSHVSTQVRGFYNSGATTGYSCAQVAYKCLTSPSDYPINEGSFRSLKVVLPPGTVVSAVKPAAMREDSGGAGRYRGGLGTEQVVQARSPININVQVDRVHCRPWGLAGGGPGSGNQVTLRIGGKEITDLPNAKVLMKRLNAGDA